MKRSMVTLGLGAILLGGSAARADTSLMHVTPKSLKETRFTVASKPGANDTVEFVIRRDIQGIDRPGRAAYLWYLSEKKGLGTRLKLEEDKDKTLIYRFSVPESRIADSRFTLWGHGLLGEAD